MRLTIFTPAYNRADLIPRLYESLCRQTNLAFEWLIIDDGSTDGTQSVVEKMRQDNVGSFPIRYYKKENGGKHTAINLGVKKAAGELFFIVDTDDIITPDAVETILSDWSTVRDQGLCGISYLRGDMRNPAKSLGHHYAEDRFVGNYIHVRYNRGVSGEDHAEVFLTSCLAAHPFTEYAGERFMSEAMVWIRLGREHDMLFVNKTIYLAEYIAGGLTLAGKALRFRCPRGGIEGSLETMSDDFTLAIRLKQTLLYIVYARFAKVPFHDLFVPQSAMNKQQAKRVSHFKLLVGMCYIPGILLYRFWKRKYNL